MKTKSLFILAGLFTILLAVTIIQSVNTKKIERSYKIGDKLFSELKPDKISTIEIKSKNTAVILKKNNKIWIIDNKYNYPADYSKIINLIKKVKNIKIGRKFIEDPQSIARLGLGSYKEQKTSTNTGIEIIFKDDKNTLINIITAGNFKSESKHAQNYIRINNTIYLTNKTFFEDFLPEQWLNKTFIDINQKDIKKIVCQKDKQIIYTIERTKKEKLFNLTTFLNKCENYDNTQIKTVLNALFSLDIKNIKAKSKKQLGKMISLTYHLVNGDYYTVYPVKGDGHSRYKQIIIKAFLKEKEHSDKKSLIRDDIDYFISNWNFKKFITDPEQFCKKP